MTISFSRTGHEPAYIAWWLQQQEKRQNANLDISGINVSVRKTVFSPDPNLTHSSTQILDNLPELKDKTFLDLGAGCGLLTVAALYKGAKRVVAVDHDPEAIANITENILAPYEAILKMTDLFDTLDERFDFIAANLPILDEAWPDIKSGTQNIYARFIKDFPKFLAPSGTCYLTFASFGEIEGFDKLLYDSKVNLKISVERKFDVNWYLLQLSH